MGAHRAACIVAHGEPESKAHALHSCDNPLCCNPHHLRWGDNQLNQYEARDRLGSQGGKLCPDLAEQIRVAEGSQSSIAKLFGITQSTVSKIKRGALWRTSP